MARRWREWIAQHPVAAAVVVGYVGLRLMLAATHPPGITPDSYDYLKGVSSDRPPLVPFLYAVLGHNTHWIVIAQAVIGAGCWLALADAARRLVSPRAWQTAMVGTVLVIGLCDMVARWDSAVLSESLAISLGVLFAAFGLRHVEQPSRHTAIAVIVSAAAWALTRELNAFYLVGLAVIWLVLPRRVSFFPLVSAGLAIAAVLGILLAGSGPPARSSMDDIVGVRVLPNASLRTYFERHGMPHSVEKLSGRLGDHHNPDDPFRTDPDLRDYRKWVAAHGRATYLQYLTRHPGWAITTPFKSPDTLNGPVTSPQLDGYGGPGYQSILATSLQRLIFEDHSSPLVIEVLIVAALLAVSAARGDRRRTWIAPAAIGLLAVPHALAAWHGDTLEVGRHAVVAAIQIRIGLLITLVVALDRLRPNPASASTFALGQVADLDRDQ